MLTFAEEILLLILDDDGSFLPTRGGAVEYILAGAVLMDLAFANRIDTDLEHLTCLDATPTGNPILDQALAHIARLQSVQGYQGMDRDLGRPGYGRNPAASPGQFD